MKVGPYLLHDLGLLFVAWSTIPTVVLGNVIARKMGESQKEEVDGAMFCMSSYLRRNMKGSALKARWWWCGSEHTIVACWVSIVISTHEIEDTQQWRTIQTKKIIRLRRHKRNSYSKRNDASNGKWEAASANINQPIPNETRLIWCKHQNLNNHFHMPKRNMQQIIIQWQRQQEEKVVDNHGHLTASSCICPREYPMPNLHE